MSNTGLKPLNLETERESSGACHIPAGVPEEKAQEGALSWTQVDHNCSENELIP